MDDFTKIKLINSLIDVVDRFYQLKEQEDIEESMRLKGFCEGLVFTLIELGALSKDEAQKIMKGLGKKRVFKESINSDKCSSIEPPLKVQADLCDIKTLSIHPVGKSQAKIKDELDLPSYLRKKRRGS
jgi:predicted ATP-dependent Lon-type protease